MHRPSHYEILRAPHVVLALAGIALAACIPDEIRAQQVPIEAAVRRTLVLLDAGDAVALRAEYAPDARVFLGYREVRELGVDEWIDLARSGEWILDGIEARVLGGTAVTLAELTGELTFPGGVTLSGSFRYSETRVRDGSVWKISQQEIWPLEDGVVAGVPSGRAPAAEAGVPPTPTRPAPDR